ncbi:L,D-transpeptidase family protein [Erythrobacter sp. NE805]|uniref:L,D-transpeptidase family protein n=1 Tax=Erythrobacter sp. NE805 TaxID=3389875 RepID=UPI00396B3EA1
MTHRTSAAPDPARQFLRGAAAWTLALGGGAALGLTALHLAGPSGGLPAMAALAAAPAAASRGTPWLDAQGQANAETRAFLALLRRAGEHGLDPAAYRIDAIETALADDPAAATALLDETIAAYARDLTVPQRLAEVIYIDPELVPAPPTLAALTAQGTPVAALEALQSGNLAYQELRAALADYRARWGHLPQVTIPQGPTLAPGSRGARVALLRERLGLPEGTSYDTALGQAVLAFRAAHGLPPARLADAATIAALNKGAAGYEALILADLDRLRALPADGRRHVLADTAAARLRMIEGGREAGSMRVVVGKPGMATPLLAGLIRYALVNPYWNVPPDLVRATIAPAVLREGPGMLARRRYVLSPDWRSTAPLDPGAVDWQAVAAGRASVWVRQLPGGRNMMGRVKFMLPNDMGIYLHDTPDKTLFTRADRRLSSGCVRVEDAARLGAWLFGRDILAGDPAPDRRVDLEEPVPVYTLRLNTGVERGRVRFRSEGLDGGEPSPPHLPPRHGATKTDRSVHIKEPSAQQSAH